MYPRDFSLGKGLGREEEWAGSGCPSSSSCEHPWELQAGPSQGWVELGGWIDTLESSPPLVTFGSGKPSPADAFCRLVHRNNAGLTW